MSCEAVLICISLIDLEHFFMWCFTISFFLKLCLFKSFAYSQIMSVEFKFIIYSRYKFCIRCMIWKYFLIISFHFLDGVHWCTEASNFDVGLTVNCCCLYCVIFKKLLPKIMQVLLFSLEFMIFALKFRSVMNFCPSILCWKQCSLPEFFWLVCFYSSVLNECTSPFLYILYHSHLVPAWPCLDDHS